MTWSGATRKVSLALAILLAAQIGAGQNLPPPPLRPSAQRVKEQINALAIGGPLTIRKADGTEYHGNLQAIELQTFAIREVDLKQTVTIQYADVDKVRKGYGRKGFGGRRVDPKRSLIVSAIVVGALLTLVIVAVANDK